MPPGSLGVPLIGHTLGFVRSMRANRVDQFFRDRISRYGAVSKLSLLGRPTALLAGPAANKFVFFNPSLVLGRAASLPHILGERSLLALHGDDHRRIRGALMDFLGPEMLRVHVGRIDAQVRQHLQDSWAGRTAVTVHPLMKRLTFDIITALVLGNNNEVKGALDRDLVNIFEGAMAIPVNLPFTAYRRSILASRRARLILQGIMRDKKARRRLQEEEEDKDDDLLSCLLSMTDNHGQQLLSNDEIVDNTLATVVAAHGSLAALMTFMVRQLADDPDTLAAMVEEHEEIAKNKAPGEALVWDDLSKMTFTWRVAQETLRLVPPVFGSSRVAVDDIEYKGYCIPKGWQVFWVADVTHRDPRIFPDPAKFDPSRFSTRMPACSFAAFGAGPRMCPGIDLVRIETLVTMHHLVRNFTWKLSGERNTFVRDPFPSPLHGLPIQLRQAAQRLS